MSDVSTRHNDKTFARIMESFGQEVFVWHDPELDTPFGGLWDELGELPDPPPPRVLAPSSPPAASVEILPNLCNQGEKEGGRLTGHSAARKRAPQGAHMYKLPSCLRALYTIYRCACWSYREHSLAQHIFVRSHDSWVDGPCQLPAPQSTR